MFLNKFFHCFMSGKELTLRITDEEGIICVFFVSCWFAFSTEAIQFYQSQFTRFVALAKGTNLVSEAAKGTMVSVFLLPLDSRATEEHLNLANGLQPVLDWCELTDTMEKAESWQYRE